MERLTIGQLARRVNVNLETIRYYERRGLIPEPPRNSSGHREYSQDAVDIMEFIKHSQALGFTLKEVSELLLLRMEPGKTCDDVKERVVGKILDVEERIANLERIREALLRLSHKFTGSGPAGPCPILDEFIKMKRRKIS